MAYSGVLDDIKTCTDLGVPRRVPILGGVSALFNVRMADITWEEYTRDVDKLVKCEVDGVKRFDYGWVYLNIDDSIEFEPLGVKTVGGGNMPLTGHEFLPPTEDTLQNLRIPDFRKTGRMPTFLEATSRIKEELGDTVCVCSRVAAPFSSVALLYGIETVMYLMVENPDLFHRTARFFVDLMVESARLQIQAGADAIWVGDTVAGSGFISPEYYREFALPGAAEINAVLRDETIVFYHAGDSSLPHLQLMADTRPHCLNVGGKIDIGEAKKALGGRVCLSGNIRGIEVLLEGTPDDVERETIRIMEAGKPGGGFIFNSEEGIPYQTPEENMIAMMRVARRHSTYHETKGKGYSNNGGRARDRACGG